MYHRTPIEKIHTHTHQILQTHTTARRRHRRLSDPISCSAVSSLRLLRNPDFNSIGLYNTRGHLRIGGQVITNVRLDSGDMGVLVRIGTGVGAANSLDMEELHGVIVAAHLLAVGSWALDPVGALGVARVGHAAATALGELGKLSALETVILGQERLERW